MIQFALKFLVALMLLSASQIIHAATLSSSVNRNPMKINQTLTLTVKYTNQAPSTDLDLSELSNDFEILATVPSTNSSMSIINGQTSRQTTTTWTITLAAKREGTFRIPAFTINGVSSAAIDIQVNNLSAAEAAQPQPLEVSTIIDDANNLSIKPGEQVIVLVEMSAAMAVNNLRGEELKIEGADIEALGQQNAQQLDNGVPRQVATWRYAVFAQDSGEIVVPAQTFTGNIGGRSSFFDSFVNGGQRVGARSIAQTINVDPIPATDGKPWFPAQDVQVSSEWSGDITQIRVGEPITRTITITAQGQRASAIPPLNIQNNHAEYKSYKDQPQLENSASAQGIIGVRSESEAIIPSQSGQLILPEQRISWWDSNADQWRVATLAEETLTVLASNNTQAQTNSPAISQTDSTSAEKNSTPNTAQPSELAWKIATICLGLLCLIQFYLLRKRPAPQLSASHSASVGNRKNATQEWQQLQKRIKQEDGKAIRKQLLIWANAVQSERTIHSLDELTKLSTNDADNQNLKAQLVNLDKSIYSQTAELNLNELSTAIDQLKKTLSESRQQQHAQDSELAPLYPL